MGGSHNQVHVVGIYSTIRLEKTLKKKVYMSTDILDLFITQTQVTHKVKGNIAFKRKYA